MALVDVLVKVFDNCDGGADLHVDVAVEEHGQVRVVGHHLAVVKGKPTPATVAAKQQLLRERCHKSINANMVAYSCMLLVQMHGPTASTLTAQMCGHHPSDRCWVRAGGVGGVLCEGLRVAF